MYNTYKYVQGSKANGSHIHTLVLIVRTTFSSVGTWSGGGRGREFSKQKKNFFLEVGRGEGGLLVNLGGKEYNLLSSDTREDRHLFITWPYNRMSSVGVNEVLMW